MNRIGRLWMVVFLAGASWGVSAFQGPPATGGQAAQPQRPTFTTRIDSVSVDVIVTDKQGRPVTDLTAADFEIREGRTPQTVETFKLIQIDDDRAVDPGQNREIRSLQDQERELQREDVRVYVLFLDDYHTRLGNSMAIRERLAKFIRSLGPRDLLAVMTPLTPTSALTFSRNHDAAARQVMAFQGRKFDYTPKHPVEEVYQYLQPAQIEALRNQIVTTALEGLCVHLGTVREGRKSIIFVSEGLTSTLPAGARTTGLYGGGMGTANPQNMQQQMAANAAQGNGLPLLDQYREIFRAASRGNTSIYPLDPRGLAVSEFDIADRVSMEDDRAALTEAMDGLRILASNTDGRAIMNSNDPGPALQQMVRDSSAYYLLGYTSSLAPRDGKFHEIRVTVKRRDVDVRARSGYWAYSDDDVARASGPVFSRPAEVEAAFDAIAEPPAGRVFRSWWTADRREDGRADVTLVWEALRTTGAVPTDVAVVASAPDGRLVFRGRAARVTDPTGRVVGRVVFPAPPGPLQLRLSAEGPDGDRLDNETRDIVVPDVTAVAPLLSIPQIFRARTVRDVQTIRAATAPVPATVRAFTRAERLLIRFQVHLPGGAMPAPVVTLLNRNGDVMSEWPVTTTGNAAEVEVPLGGVPPGEYLFRVKATTTADSPAQLVAFRITG